MVWAVVVADVPEGGVLFCDFGELGFYFFIRGNTKNHMEDMFVKRMGFFEGLPQQLAQTDRFLVSTHVFIDLYVFFKQGYQVFLEIVENRFFPCGGLLEGLGC